MSILIGDIVGRMACKQQAKRLFSSIFLVELAISKPGGRKKPKRIRREKDEFGL